MSGKVAYLDTSAFLKLLIPEPESPALRAFLAGWPERISSSLLRTEAVRALRRAGSTGKIGRARRLLRTVRLVRLEEGLLDRAAELEPARMRTLDAIHLSSALAVGSELGAFVTYDESLGAAARASGLTVCAPTSGLAQSEL